MNESMMEKALKESCKIELQAVIMARQLKKGVFHGI